MLGPQHGILAVLEFLLLQRDIMTMATLTKESIEMGWLTYSSEIQSIIIIVEHGSMLADMVLEKLLRVLHFAGNRKWSETLDMA